MIQIPTTVVVDVRRVLDEDVRNGDKTVDLIPADADGQALLITRPSGDRWNPLCGGGSQTTRP